MLTEFLATLSLVFAQAVAPPVGQSQAAPPAAVNLSSEQRASLRCAAAFAVIAAYQDMGEEAALEWPAMEVRGREFFVRTSARLIDETGASREQIEALLSQEATQLASGDKLQAIKPACLLMLEVSGL